MIKDIVKQRVPRPLLKRYWRIKRLFRNLYYLTWRSPVLVYQMGKVGSTSVYESLLACGAQAVHFHKIEPVYKPILARKDRVEVITLVREPIDQRISDFFQNLDRYPQAYRVPIDLDLAALGEIFLGQERFWQPSPWFDREMRDQLGIDVYEFPFPREKGWLVIESGSYRVLVLKLELDDAVKEQVISNFLNLRDFALVHANVARDKTYAETYQAFVQTIRLPEAYVEAMCNARFTKHFYSEVEIEAMRSKWFKKAG